MATNNQSPGVMKIAQCCEGNVRKITISRTKTREPIALCAACRYIPCTIPMAARPQTREQHAR
jgi:hypothetical protein